MTGAGCGGVTLAGGYGGCPGALEGPCRIFFFCGGNVTAMSRVSEGVCEVSRVLWGSWRLPQVTWGGSGSPRRSQGCPWGFGGVLGCLSGFGGPWGVPAHPHPPPDVLAGYNGTIFAYGQTSSGKTHTMEVRGPGGGLWGGQHPLGPGTPLGAHPPSTPRPGQTARPAADGHHPPHRPGHLQPHLLHGREPGVPHQGGDREVWEVWEVGS